MSKMTVAELIAKLETFDQQSQVAMSKDEEGNGYYEDIYPEPTSGMVVLYPGGYEKEIDELEDYEETDEDGIE